MDLAALIARPEGKTLEFKRDLSSRTTDLRACCAFANTAGGAVVFGVEDSRDVCGVDDPLDFEERLANVISDGITPRLLADIDIIAWRRTHFVVVTIHPGASRPYYLTSEGLDRGTYVRVGSTNRLADEPLRAELARTSRGESFDESPVADGEASEIGLTAVREAFAPGRDVTRRDLESLRLVTKAAGRTVPTVGGLLLFGENRQVRFPDAWLQAGRFRGADKSRIVDSLDIVASLPVTAELAMAFVRRSVAVETFIEGARRTEQWQFPLAAVREAIINAIVHADYSQQGAPLRLAVFDDRLVVENPGMLVPGLTIDDVLEGVSRLRNRVIGRVFRELGLIEQWGSGVQRMVTACRDAGLPDPAFEELGGRFRVTIFGEQTAAPALDAIDGAIVATLSARPDGLSTADIATRIERTARTARTRLKALVSQGVVVEVGSGPNDPLKRYLLAEERAKYHSV